MTGGWLGASKWCSLSAQSMRGGRSQIGRQSISAQLDEATNWNVCERINLEQKFWVVYIFHKFKPKMVAVMVTFFWWWCQGSVCMTRWRRPCCRRYPTSPSPPPQFGTKPRWRGAAMDKLTIFRPLWPFLKVYFPLILLVFLSLYICYTAKQDDNGLSWIDSSFKNSPFSDPF